MESFELSPIWISSILSDENASKEFVRRYKKTNNASP